MILTNQAIVGKHKDIENNSTCLKIMKKRFWKRWLLQWRRR